MSLPRGRRFVGVVVGRRVQGALVWASLASAVAGTAILVAPAGRLEAATVPVQALGGSASLAASASASAAAGPVAASAPAPLPSGLRVAVEGGDPFVAYGLADRLVGAGAAVGGVDPAASKEAMVKTTTIVYYDVEALPAADRIRAMLGGGTLRRQRVFQPPVDVTIVLGKDLAHR